MSLAPILYQESRLSPTPASPSHVLRIDTSASQQSSLFGAGRKRAFAETSSHDEESYSRKCLATEGSVFFRRKSRSPRAFLWRVLEDRKTLEIQCVDLVHDSRGTGKNESWLTYRIAFKDAILRRGVAFADPEEADALECFVFTEGTELYTFTLKRDLLTREFPPDEFDASTCFKKYTSGSFLFRQPYRMIAVSSFEILFSLHDGGLMRLERQSNESGAQWRETFFSEGGWSQTLRGIIPLRRQQLVRYGDLELEPNSIADMAKSPDGKYIWTVGLNHELKAWDTQTGKPIVYVDLLNEPQEREGGKRMQKFVMAAEQGTLLQIITLPMTVSKKSVAKMDVDAQKYYLVVHSPKDHQFKFYKVSSTLAPSEVRDVIADDLHPRAMMIPPIDQLMNTNVWHLENFFVKPGPDWRDTQLWVRARSGTLSKIFTLRFDLLDEHGGAADIEEVWSSGWTVVDPGSLTSETLKESLDFPGEIESSADPVMTPSEKWLEFLFRPGRFSTASLETALHVYRKGRGLPASSGKGLNAPEPFLQERLTQAITAKIMLRRMPNEQPDYERYRVDVQAQWKTFYSLLSHLHNKRSDSIALAVDPSNGLSWSVSADFVAPIRAASSFDMLSLNSHAITDGGFLIHDSALESKIFPSDEAVSQCQLLTAAKDFRVHMSAEFREKFANAAVAEALAHGPGNHELSAERAQTLYESSNFGAEVMDDEFQALTDATESLGGLGSIDESMILSVFEALEKDAELKGKDQGVSLSRYGDKLTIAVATETLDRDRGIILDLLNLVVFMAGDLDQSDLATDFIDHLGEIFEAIMVRLKHNEMLSWLAGKLVPVPQQRHQSSNLQSQEKTQDGSVVTITLLERIFIGDWKPISQGLKSLPELLTAWCKGWTYGADLFSNWDGVTAHIMAFLIKEKLSELAPEFQKFLSQGNDSPSWLRYLEGRLHLITGDYATSSVKFRSAAEGLAETRKMAGIDTAHLLSADEMSYFGHGRCMYYQHIAALFEALKIHSYTADFAALALEYLDSDSDFSRSLAEIDRRKDLTDSPIADRIQNAMDEIQVLKIGSERDEILNRIFNALVQIGRFELAFAALMKISDPRHPTKKKNLEALVKACIGPNAVETLFGLPFEEANLASEADAVLLSLAKKSLASGFTTAGVGAGGAPAYHEILYAFRTQRGDFRGAAEILFEHLERLRHSSSRGGGGGITNPHDESLLQAYVLLINTLECCGDDHAWLLAEPIDGVHDADKRRRLVTLADVRREYCAELDRRSDILQGRFPLVGSAMEVDVL